MFLEIQWLLELDIIKLSFSILFQILFTAMPLLKASVLKAFQISFMIMDQVLGLRINSCRKARKGNSALL
jgi:hypothetical protein